MSKNEQGKPKPKIVALKKAPQTKAKANTAKADAAKADAAKAFKDAFGFGEGKMRELAEAFQQSLEIKDRAVVLEARLSDSRVEARDESHGVTYVCSGLQAPILVEIRPEAIAGRSAEEVSGYVLAVARQGYRRSKAHMMEKLQKMTNSLSGSFDLDERQLNWVESFSKGDGDPEIITVVSEPEESE